MTVGVITTSAVRRIGLSEQPGKLPSLMAVQRLSEEPWLKPSVETHIRRTTLLLSVFVLVVPFSFAIVSAQAAESANIIQSEALTWAPAQGFPPGAQIAMLYGDPQRMVRLRYV
jgi:hypothetical protein